MKLYKPRALKWDVTGIAFFLNPAPYFGQIPDPENTLPDPRDQSSKLIRGGGGLLGLIFAGYVSLPFQSAYPIIVYSVAKYRPHLIHFGENVIFAIPT